MQLPVIILLPTRSTITLKYLLLPLALKARSNLFRVSIGYRGRTAAKRLAGSRGARCGEGHEAGSVARRGDFRSRDEFGLYFGRFDGGVLEVGVRRSGL